jgi:3-hydroxy acid dehydrogenase/malonic semialdehyde reductase
MRRISYPAPALEFAVNKGNSGLVKGVARAPEIAEEDIGVMMATNVTGLINMTQAVLPIFRKRANGGSGDIINVGSIAGMPENRHNFSLVSKCKANQINCDRA